MVANNSPPEDDPYASVDGNRPKYDPAVDRFLLVCFGVVFLIVIVAAAVFILSGGQM
jgi:hypothetical protein